MPCGNQGGVHKVWFNKGCSFHVVSVREAVELYLIRLSLFYRCFIGWGVSLQRAWDSCGQGCVYVCLMENSVIRLCHTQSKSDILPIKTWSCQAS